MELAPRERLLVAKAENAGERWLPLYIHLSDTAGVMDKLLSEYLADSFSDMCKLSRDELKKTALFLAYSHDIGKATAVFQSKIIKAVPFRKPQIEKYGVELPDFCEFHDYKETPHTLAGENILLFLGCPNEVAVVVGAHHGVPTNKLDLDTLGDDPAYAKNYFASLKKEKLWKDIWRNYYDFAMEKSGMKSFSEIPILNRQAQMLFTGLLIMADWIASNTEWFPLLSVNDWEDERGLETRIEEGWEAFQLTDVWCPVNEIYSETFFKQTFLFLPRQIQSDVLKIISSVNESGIYIVEAPMGCGKTEIALAAAEILAAKFERTGLFFGLPTQATSNGIFPRVLEWAKKQSDEMFQSIQLAHGSAMLNNTFMDIERGIPEVYDGDMDGGIVVHSWFCGKKQSCLADFVVGTVDQLLMMALKRKHVMLLHLGLSQKVVVIDEVHAYDAYMNCYLERALSWLGMYRTPVVLLSATLPADRRRDLIKAYQNERKLDTDIEKTKAYPLLTWTDGGTVYQRKLSYHGVHKEVRIEISSEENALSDIGKIVQEGGCIGIILNTVKRAQNLLDILREKITDNVFLYHAQYIFPDRMDKEEKLIKKVGKDSTEKERSGLVVVGSQVLEQSLDLDFDLLITDLCPMDLLLQRIGRLHRHEKHDSMRPESVKAARCLVLGADVPEFEEGAKTIYGEWLLARTKDFLPEKVMIPDDISVLVQKVYRELKPIEGEQEYYEEYCRVKKGKENRAGGFLLNKAKSKRDIHGLLDAGITDANAEASVRDGISSVEVIVMIRDRNEIFFLPWQNGGVKVSDSDIVDTSICRKIAEQKLRLPSVLCQEYNIDDTIREIEGQCKEYIISWQNSYWLRGELVLFLNKNLECMVNGYHLYYNKDVGLSYEKDVE